MLEFEKTSRRELADEIVEWKERYAEMLEVYIEERDLVGKKVRKHQPDNECEYKVCVNQAVIRNTGINIIYLNCTLCT